MPPATRVPEDGQLAEVRGRRFVALYVRRSALDSGRSQHLVSLRSVEDGSLGEELEVIWEVEIGARAFDREQLPQPTSFDAPERLEAFLDAVRWGVISAVDQEEFHAPFRSGIEIEDYQLEPLVRAVRMPRVNLLIADAVGLGKTVEAGLIVQELILRNRVRTVLVACPAGLQIQWREEMRAKFGLDFRIVDSELLRQLRRSRGVNANPWGHFPRLITSYAFLRRDRNLRMFRDLLPSDGRPTYPRAFDLLICDEAHNLAPSGPEAAESQQTAAIRSIAPHFEHRLFLSATPHNGYTPSFTALLELLDNQRYARGAPINTTHLREITMIRRLRSDLEQRSDGTARFPARRLIPLEVAFPAEEREVHALLTEYGELRKAAADPGRRWPVEFLLKLLKKRLFSSPAAFHRTVTAHRNTLQGGGSGRKPPAPEGILRRIAEGLEEGGEDDAAWEDAWDQAVEEVTGGAPPLSRREHEILDKLLAWADRASHTGDARGKRLVEWVRDTVRPDGRWNNERVILFTEFRDTQNWLLGLLAAEGLAGKDRILKLYGGMLPEEREQVKAAFQAHPAESPVRILLATDAAAEGINLQNHCHRLLHVEIPWNPNRMEQRNGRIDRHGQRFEPQVFHFVPKGFQSGLLISRDSLDADMEFLARAIRKVDQIREDLGKVGPVIARQVEEAMLGKRRHLDTSGAEAEAEPARRLLKAERDQRAWARRLSERYDEVRESLRISPESMQRVVRLGLELAGQLPLAEERTGDRSVWRVPALRGSWEACLEGLAHPFTGRIRPITFDPAVAAGRDDVVLAHLNHRLVQMCLRLLRAQVWETGEGAELSRCAVRSIPAGLLPQPAVAAYGRLLILGGTHRKLDEELITAGVRLAEGGVGGVRAERMRVGELDCALRASSPARSDHPAARRLLSAWSVLDGRLRSALQARADELGRGAADTLGERAEREKRDVEARLGELRDLLEECLRGPAPADQPALPLGLEAEERIFSEQALLRRIESIPDEIRAEQEQIDRHYAEPTFRLFPVAAVFLVPEGRP